MPNYAIHENGLVVNVIVAESQEIAETVAGLPAIQTAGEPWLGWRLVDDAWVAPEPAPEE